MKAKWLNVSHHGVLILFSLVMAIPFILMILSSLKLPDEIYSQPLTIFPKQFHWENYKNAWNNAPFDKFFMNSLLMAFGSVIGQVITCSLAGYALAVMKFKGKNALFIVILATMMVPFEATIIPSYLVMTKLNLINTHIGLILPTVTSVFGIFLMRQFFLTVPKDILEASVLDGSSTIRTFFQIAMPLAKPMLATLSLFSFLNAWNSYLWPLLMTTETNMRTVQVGLSYLVDQELGTKWGELLAASTFIIIPILIVFILLQKYFVKGIAQTGIK